MKKQEIQIRKAFKNMMWMRMKVPGSVFCRLCIVGSFRAEFCLLQLCYLFIWKITPYVCSASGLGDQMVVLKDFFPGELSEEILIKAICPPISIMQI